MCFRDHCANAAQKTNFPLLHACVVRYLTSGVQEEKGKRESAVGFSCWYSLEFRTFSSSALVALRSRCISAFSCCLPAAVGDRCIASSFDCKVAFLSVLGRRRRSFASVSYAPLLFIRASPSILVRHRKAPLASSFAVLLAVSVSPCLRCFVSVVTSRDCFSRLLPFTSWVLRAGLMLPVVVASRAQRSVAGGHGALVAQAPAYLCACCDSRCICLFPDVSPFANSSLWLVTTRTRGAFSSDGLIFLSVPERSVSMACRV